MPGSERKVFFVYGSKNDKPDDGSKSQPSSLQHSNFLSTVDELF